MPLKVMSCSYGGNSVLVENLRPVIESLGLDLVAIHEHSNANIQWTRDTWKEHLSKADIIIVPSNYELQPAKSANRVTQALALGKPTICSPLPAYLDVERDHPGCVLIARSPEEWKEKLLLLRDSECLRRELSQRALVASQAYSIDVIGQKWANVLISVCDDPIDVIITTYNNEEYLKLCIDSIIKNTDIDYKIIISDAGSDESMWIFLNTLKEENYFSLKLKGLKIIGKKNERKNYSETCNAGIRCSTSKYFVILNSDVIVSKRWLFNMLDKMKNEKILAACGVLSNCDRGWLF